MLSLQEEKLFLTDSFVTVPSQQKNMTQTRSEELPQCVVDNKCTGEIKLGNVVIGYCAAYSWSRHGTPEQKLQAEELERLCPVGGYPYPLSR